MQIFKEPVSSIQLVNAEASEVHACLAAEDFFVLNFFLQFLNSNETSIASGFITDYINKYYSHSWGLNIN